MDYDVATGIEKMIATRNKWNHSKTSRNLFFSATFQAST